MTDWSPLSRELANWHEQDRIASLWLRDDDAEAPTPQLDRLLAIAQAHAVSVLLAIIPTPTAFPLAERLRGESLVEPAVHGIRHLNRAGEGEKKAELGAGRPADVILAELAATREHMNGLFPAVSGILVPPWNRIARAVAQRIGEAGFTAISTFGWRPVAPFVRQLNTHVDLIDWRSARRWRRLDEVIALLAAALATSRLHHGFAPVGILSHHLLGSGESDRMLEQLLEGTAGQSGLRWASAGELIEEQRIANSE